MAGSAHGGHGHREEICSDILSFVHRNMLRRCPRVLKQINQISSSAQIPASRARDSRRPASLLQVHVLLFLFFFKCTSLKFRNIGCIFFLLFTKNIFLRLPVQLVALAKNNGGAAADAVAEATGVPLASRGPQ